MPLIPTPELGVCDLAVQSEKFAKASEFAELRSSCHPLRSLVENLNPPPDSIYAAVCRLHCGSERSRGRRPH